MPKNHLNEDSTTKKIYQSFMTGTGLMLAQAPVVNALNHTSVVACRYNLSTTAAFSFIYQGKVSGKNASVKNFGAGMSGHLGKEFPRLLFKPAGLYVYKPWLSKHYPPYLADLAFAGALSMTEMLINPFDTWRVNIQAGSPLESSFHRLYAGSLGNGVRQFVVWWTYSFSGRCLDNTLTTYTSIDPHSFKGAAIKATPQALFLTGLVYPIERIKNELQYKNEPTSSYNSKYGQTISRVYKAEGGTGFFRGFPAKVGSSTVLVLGANILVGLGSRQTKVPGSR